MMAVSRVGPFTNAGLAQFWPSPVPLWVKECPHEEQVEGLIAGDVGSLLLASIGPFDAVRWTEEAQ